MTTGLVISIDCSTTACKAIAWNRDGLPVAEARSAYRLLEPTPNWYEQDAEQWWRAACTALNRLLDTITAAHVEALCVTHQRESFVPVDRHGTPLRNAILWLDERSHTQVRDLERIVGRERFHQITGKPLTTNPSATKILWLARNEPEIMARAFMILDAHAFLVQRLTGAFRTSLASADPMGLIDLRDHAWSTDLVQAVGVQLTQLPELLVPGAIIGYVSDEAAATTGLPSGLPIVAGAGDGQCAGLGCNAIGGDRAALNLGTAVVSGILSAAYAVDRAFRTLCAPIAGLYYLETVIQGGTFTVSWFLDRFAVGFRNASGQNHSPSEKLESEASKIPPGSQGLMLVPYWNHAMTPYWDPAAAGITIGWTGAHGPEHFYRAILEGIAFEQRLVGGGVMAATGRRFSEYVALGGGSRSDLWCQIIADVTGVPVVRSTTSEATCLGAGILAAAAAGWYPDAAHAAEAMTDTSERFLPIPETHAIYDRLYYEVYQMLFPTLQPLVDRLTRLTRG